MMLPKSPLPKIFCLLWFAFLACYLAILPGCATSPVIKMPQRMPDIVRTYKSITLMGNVGGMQNSQISVKKGDFITIMAMGEVDTWPEKGEKIYIKNPERGLMIRIGNDYAIRYTGNMNIKGWAEGNIYLGVIDGPMDLYGEPRSAPNSPQNYYLNNRGFFVVDIIVWRVENPIRMAEFMEEMSQRDPANEVLKNVADDFKQRKEIFLAEQKATSEIEETKKALVALKEGEVTKAKEPTKIEHTKPSVTGLKEKQPHESQKPENKKETFNQTDKNGQEQKSFTLPAAAEKKEAKIIEPPEQIPPLIQKPQGEKKLPVSPKEMEIPKTKEVIATSKKETLAITDEEKEKKIAELNQRLQKAMLSLTNLEEMKKKMAEQQKREAELASRLEALEAEKMSQPKNLPVIAIANPKEGITVDSEYVSLFGVAEHEKGITRFEIKVNNQPVDSKGQRDIKIIPKEQKRIEFSERIPLREGKNELTIIAQEKEGLVAQKTIFVQMTKKREEVWAVVVGISKYRNIPSLKYASRDAQEFYRYLTEVNRVPKDNIWLLLDEDATLDKLRSTLGTHLRRKAGKDDLVLIYLAGHGGTEKDAASYDGDGLEKYILPHNADPKDLYASAMPMSEIARIFQRISSERLVFISDTCYSGASGGRTVPLLGTRANVSGAFLERLSQGKGRVILTASDANEVSVEKDELKHGVFTYYLLEALRGKGDLDGDGVVSVDEAYRYVSMKVPQATGQDQHPVKKGEMTGQIILGVVK
jgi:hypothetical protein